METYSINALLTFLKAQEQEDFCLLRFALNVFDDESIPKWARREMIADIFRQHGLLECETEKTNLEGKRLLVNNNGTINIQPHECLPVQPMKLRLLNGTLETFLPLN